MHKFFVSHKTNSRGLIRSHVFSWFSLIILCFFLWKKSLLHPVYAKLENISWSISLMEQIITKQLITKYFLYFEQGSNRQIWMFLAKYLKYLIDSSIASKKWCDARKELINREKRDVALKRDVVGYEPRYMLRHREGGLRGY